MLFDEKFFIIPYLFDSGYVTFHNDTHQIHASNLKKKRIKIDRLNGIKTESLVFKRWNSVYYS